MGEEVKMSEYPAGHGGDGEGSGDDERVSEWELGLPNADDLTPLSQLLIPPDLLSAFSISPEPYRTILDVNRASQNTLSGLRGQPNSFSSNNFKSFNEEKCRDPMVIEDETADKDGSESRKVRRVENIEEADSALRTENSMDDQSARTLKRPRLVWTPQLHKRFVDVVGHLGIKTAVPKTIMQLMNVEGLTRENVASHLQKYRLYLKRMQGLSNEGPSSSDQLFASTPVPQNLHESDGGSGHVHGNGHVPVPIHMPYAPSMMQMQVMGMANHNHGHMGMPVGNINSGHGFESHHPYNMMQQRDWPGNNFGSVVSYPPLAPNEK